MWELTPVSSWIQARVCFRSGVSSSFASRDCILARCIPSRCYVLQFVPNHGRVLVTPYVGMGVVLKTRQERIEPRTVSLAVLASKDRR